MLFIKIICRIIHDFLYQAGENGTRKARNYLVLILKIEFKFPQNKEKFICLFPRFRGKISYVRRDG